MSILHKIVLISVAIFAGFSGTVAADHEAMVAGEVIFLADASLAHGENCDDVHYHGDLNGKEDPDVDGCGHGIVTILKHDDNDESIIPKAEEEEDDSPSGWQKFKTWTIHVVDIVFQVFGASSPETIHDSVEIVEDASESIAENVDNIEEYRESVPEEEDTLGIYDTSTDGLEEGSLSQRFFNWVNSFGE